MKARPVLFVLAGANGAGKSSIGGHLIEQAGLSWFNPDTFARELRLQTGCSQSQANAVAWAEGLRRIDDAIRGGWSHAFETTLGGSTMPARVRASAATHDVIIWFCGLASEELHVARVRARVEAGGHDIPESKIRARYPRALRNLIALMPHVAHLRVYDNSEDAPPGRPVPDPLLVLEMRMRKVWWPRLRDVTSLERIPRWARPLVEAAFVVQAEHA